MLRTSDNEKRFRKLLKEINNFMLKENIKKMFEKLRHYDGTTGEDYSYPRQCGPYKIDRIRDLTVGLLVDFKNNGERSKPVIFF